MTIAAQHPSTPPEALRRGGRRRGRTAEAAAPGPSSGPGGQESADRPRLAEGIDLVGEFEGSGYVDPHYLARRSNGTVIQLSRLLFLVAEASDGQRTLDQIAAQVGERFGRTVSPDNVATLVDEKLRPLGVLADRDGNSPEVATADPLLALRWKTTVVPERVTPRLVRLLHPLFLPVCIVIVGLALVGFDAWLFFAHGLAESMRLTIRQPLMFLVVGGLVVVSAALHELGHAAACSYGGARPGRMGAGVYVAWPAFYTDVTDAYRLGKGARLRTDLGGVYFNALVVLALATTYAFTSYEPLLLVCFVLQVQIVQQMLPLLRLDGYYVLSDAIGVPDLFRRTGPILRSALPWRRPSPEVLELTRRARYTVTAWVMVVIPLLLVNMVYILLSAPRLVATAWDSAARQYGVLTSSAGLEAGVAALQLVILAIPTIGMTLTFSRLGRRVAAASWSWSQGSAARRVLVTLAALAVVGGLAVSWWPDGRLSPYHPGERGTFQQGVTELRTAGQGRPLLRSPRQAQQPLPAVRPGTSAVTGEPVGRIPSPGRVPGGATPSPAASTGVDPSTGVTPSPGSTPGTGPTPSPRASVSVSGTATPSPSASVSVAPSGP
jgi:putative peptide zinc metalloprotease protein